MYLGYTLLFRQLLKTSYTPRLWEDRGFYPQSGQKHPDYKSGLSGILLFLGQARTNK